MAMQNYDQNFRLNMVRERKRLGWSQADLLKALESQRFEGVHQTTISRIEKGIQAPKLNEAIAIATALGANFTAMLRPVEEFTVVQSVVAAIGSLEQSWKDFEQAVISVDLDKVIVRANQTLADGALRQLESQAADDNSVQELAERFRTQLSKADRLLAMDYSSAIDGVFETSNDWSPDDAS